jgi:hypothetical protein
MKRVLGLIGRQVAQGRRHNLLSLPNLIRIIFRFHFF